MFSIWTEHWLCRPIRIITL
ncbi:hypothetical protein LINPERHAP1_LOCUS6504 [Linum perenne]